MQTLDQIRIRDPFVLPVKSEHRYYLFGTTDDNVWGGPAVGFDCYYSGDLNYWSEAIPAFRPGPSFWGSTQFWAPEVYAWQGRYVMFATFSDGTHRGTAALVSDNPAGPYETWSEGALTPHGWACLDGTLYVDIDDQPWIVYCREWLEVGDGEIYAQKLDVRLKRTIGLPQRLFRASQAAWSVSPSNAPAGTYVTDGPWVFQDQNRLRMLWSTHSASGYALGLAESDSGLITGPWHVLPDPVQDSDGGHGMIFNTFEGARKLAIHHPNAQPLERAMFIDLPHSFASAQGTP